MPNAVNGPQSLGFALLVREGILQVNEGLEGFVIRWRVIAGEGDVRWGMEVLCSDFQNEPREGEEGIDDDGDCTATFDGEGSILWGDSLARTD
jgi:hypothetical protein